MDFSGVALICTSWRFGLASFPSRSLKKLLCFFHVTCKASSGAIWFSQPHGAVKQNHLLIKRVAFRNAAPCTSAMSTKVNSILSPNPSFEAYSGGSRHAGRTGEYFPPPCVGWKACGSIGISTHTCAWDGQEVPNSSGPPASLCHHTEQKNITLPLPLLFKTHVEENLLSTQSRHLWGWIKRLNNDLKVIWAEK